MASYYQTRRTQKIMGGHICSKCKSVILTEFVLTAIANSRWSQKKAQAGAEEAAENGLDALRAFPEKPFLVSCEYENRTYSLVNGFILEGLNHVCPYCGNRERWQLPSSLSGACRVDPNTGVYLVTEVPEESRLTIFESGEGLNAWRVKTMAALELEKKQYWEDHPEEKEDVCAQYQKMNEQLTGLQSQKETCREGSKLLAAKVESKTQELKGYSFFSAERKECKAQLKALNKEHEAQYAKDLEQERTLGKGIQDLQKQIKELKISNPGVLGEVETVTPKDAPNCTAIRSC